MNKKLLFFVRSSHRRLIWPVCGIPIYTIR